MADDRMSSILKFVMYLLDPRRLTPRKSLKMHLRIKKELASLSVNYMCMNFSLTSMLFIL